MTERGHHSPEATRRIRALVRAAYSPAVWAMALVSVFMTTSRFISVDKTHAVQVDPVVLTLVLFLLFLLFFLTAGSCDAFARSKNPVSLGEALRSASQVFGSFLWLMLKASLVGFVLFEVIVMIVAGIVGVDVFKDGQNTAMLFTLFASVLALVFVYWMPIVFVRRNFRLFETLGLALGVVRERPGSMVYLGVLLLTPVAVLSLAGSVIPAVLAIPVVAAGEWLRWSAYSYCVDVITAAPPQTAQE